MLGQKVFICVVGRERVSGTKGVQFLLLKN